MAQHSANERIPKYKLKVYQNNFPNFICGNPTNIKVLGQNEEIEAMPNVIAQEEEVQTKEPHNLKGGTT